MNVFRTDRSVAARLVLTCCMLNVVQPSQAQAPAHARSMSATKTFLVLQSATDPLALVGADVARRSPGAWVMASSDCPEMRPGLYVLVRTIAADPSPVRSGGAYTKRCTPRADSLTARNLPAVDGSFAAMRAAPINFSGIDIVSSVKSGLLIRPWYVAARDDPREGLRVAVDDVMGPRRPIERDCTAPEVARTRTNIAIACAIEQVREQYVYRTTVYRISDLAPIRTIPRCRQPRLAPNMVRCASQSVSANGEVKLAGDRSITLR
ncbi:MAG: hypothetical protein EOP64_06335 [Sphingomonas sp.]|nr:MAG: hypothetical protein EOP64_06335 [Sphingomonas sp.]